MGKRMIYLACLDIVWHVDAVVTGGSAMATRINRTEKLDLRLTAEAKHTLAAAAQAQRRSLSEFVLESALDRAEEALADRRVFQLSPEKWDAFVEALDAPPRDLPRLRKLLSEPDIFKNDKQA
ncbi:MAG: DUF1778 domain-containing protein [Novosphingobium sp.]